MTAKETDSIFSTATTSLLMPIVMRNIAKEYLKKAARKTRGPEDVRYTGGETQIIDYGTETKNETAKRLYETLMKEGPEVYPELTIINNKMKENPNEYFAGAKPGTTVTPSNRLNIPDSEEFFVDIVELYEKTMLQKAKDLRIKIFEESGKTTREPVKGIDISGILNDVKLENVTVGMAKGGLVDAR